MYSEIVADLDGLERESDAKPSLVLPRHRSHVDYLVISYSSCQRPHMPAHRRRPEPELLPAGAHLQALRAFFLRRSYTSPRPTATFREYVRKLVREGYWLVFPRGRSRTGKMLPPKLGVLGTIIDSIRTGSALMRLVPITWATRGSSRSAYQQEPQRRLQEEREHHRPQDDPSPWSSLAASTSPSPSPSASWRPSKRGRGPRRRRPAKAFVRRMGYRVLSDPRRGARDPKRAHRARALDTLNEGCIARRSSERWASCSTS